MDDEQRIKLFNLRKKVIECHDEIHKIENNIIKKAQKTYPVLFAVILREWEYDQFNDGGEDIETHWGYYLTRDEAKADKPSNSSISWAQKTEYYVKEISWLVAKPYLINKLFCH